MSDTDSDGAPEVITMSKGREDAEELKKKEIRNQIEINTQRNQKKRQREEARQARRKAILPKDLLVSLAEKEKENGDQVRDPLQESDSEEESEESEEIAPPPPKIPAISKIIDGIEVQVQKEAYKKTVVNTSAKDFLNQHFFGDRVVRSTYDPNIARKPNTFVSQKK